MKEWIKKFFAVDNLVNENTVMGVLFAIVLIIATFSGVEEAKYYILAGEVAVFFGLGAFKK
jgi:hypothetical protein